MSHEGASYRRSFRQIKHVTRREYSLNSNEAVQIIWRSARIATETGIISDAELESTRESKYIGEINKLEGEINSLTNFVKKL